MYIDPAARAELELLLDGADETARRRANMLLLIGKGWTVQRTAVVMRCSVTDVRLVIQKFEEGGAKALTDQNAP